MAKRKQEKGVATNGFKRFLLLICIPVVLLTVIGSIVFSLSGISPMEQARATASQLPIVSAWISEDNDDDGEETSPLAEKDEEIANLAQQLQRAEDTIEELEAEIEQIEDDEAYAEASAQELEEAEAPEALTRIARVYENMKPRQAAEIMEELTNEAILLHMSEMNDDGRSVILENMDPERAAEITTLLAD